MIVDLVFIPTSDGMQLQGAFYEPPGTAKGSIPAVVLNPGTAGTFYRPLMKAIASELAAAGYAALTISTRGHDLIARDLASRRIIGSAYEKVIDCRIDFEAAFSHLAERGYDRFALLGHSLGATKAIWYLAHDPDPRVAAGINCSGPRWSARAYAASADAEAFQRSLAQAQAMVAAGTPDALFEADFPRPDGVNPNLITAANYLDKYAAETYNLEEWADRIRVPLLRVDGDLDTGTAQRYVAGILQEMVHSRVDVAIIPGGDHAYTGLEHDAGRIVAGWLDTL